MVATNQEILGMLTAHRKAVQEVLNWQKSVLQRMNEQSEGSNAEQGPEVLDFLTDGFDVKDTRAFREFIEASITKLSQVLE